MSRGTGIAALVFVCAAAVVSLACTRSATAPPIEIVAVADAAAAPSAPTAPSAPSAAGTTSGAVVDAPPSPSAPPIVADAGAALPAGVGAADVDDVREAALRHMFRKNASGLQQRAAVYCIAFEQNTDPAPAFVARFRASSVPVKVASACTASASGGVRDKSGGGRGLVFRIDHVRFVDRDHAVVDGGYYEAGLSASGNEYSLERRGAAWIVTKDVMHWIS